MQGILCEHPEKPAVYEYSGFVNIILPDFEILSIAKNAPVETRLIASLLLIPTLFVAAFHFAFGLESEKTFALRANFARRFIPQRKIAGGIFAATEEKPAFF